MTWGRRRSLYDPAVTVETSEETSQSTDLPAARHLLALTSAVLGRTDELVALSWPWRGRQAVAFDSGYLLSRVAPNGTDHVIEAG